MNSADFYHEYQILQPLDLLSWIGQNILFGWRDRTGFTHPTVNDPESYTLQTPVELLASRTGICWDVVELMRDWFTAMTGLPIQTYYIFYDDGAGCPSHTVLTFQYKNRICWIEPPYFGAALPFDGIHSYENEADFAHAFQAYIVKCFQAFHFLPDDYDIKNFRLYAYSKPPDHINGCEMRNHIETGRPVVLNFS